MKDDSSYSIYLRIFLYAFKNLSLMQHSLILKGNWRFVFQFHSHANLTDFRNLGRLARIVFGGQ